MDRLDIISLYQQGHSINFIVNAYYKYKKGNCKNVYSFLDRKILIINRDIIKKEECREYVENTIYDYMLNNNSVKHFFEN